MLNILIPLAGKSKIFEGQYFPKSLYEINNRLMVEYPIAFFKKLQGPKRFIFILREEECIKFHLDKTLKLLTDDSTVIIKQNNDTHGAVCSCLLAVDHINTEAPLIISNGDQYLDVDINDVLEFFKKRQCQGGVICFDSVHPQWSYAKLDKEENIIQTAEKNPISRNAIAGFYYFQKGNYFVGAAERSIEKEAHVNGIYYIAPTYNELILDNFKLKALKIQSSQYHSFFSFAKIRDFEKINIKIPE